MEKLVSVLIRIKDFIIKDIWEAEVATLSRLKAFVFRGMRIVYMVVKGFIDDNCQLKAGALTYKTALAIVPFLAFIFAVAKGFGIQDHIKPLILERFTLGHMEMVEKLIRYVSNTNMKLLGYVGLFTLLMIVIGLLISMEKAFNDIWGIKKPRTVLRRVSDYVSILVVYPIIFMVITGFNAVYVSSSFISKLSQIELFQNLFSGFSLSLPYLVVWTGFSLIYVLMPNTKVKFSAGIFGGVIAGTIWQLVQWFYLNFQVGISRYNAIYGSFASLPIFLFWLYLSWLIVLLGAEISFAYQNEKNYQLEKSVQNVNFKSKEILGLCIVYRIAKSFYLGHGPLSASRLASELSVPIRLVREVVYMLTKSGIIDEVVGAEPTYQPEVPLEQITIRKIEDALRNYGEDLKLKRNDIDDYVLRLKKETDRVIESTQYNENFQKLFEKERVH